MDRLRTIAQETTREISDLIAASLTGDQVEKINVLVEKAVIRGLLEGQHRAVDAALHCPEADQDLAHKIATAIRRKNDLMIVNLSSMR